jgi:choline-sulfatase
VRRRREAGIIGSPFRPDLGFHRVAPATGTYSWRVHCAAGLLALSVAGCSRSVPPSKPRDVLLITIDTARADHFSYAGASIVKTPRVDAMAEQGAGFTNAMTPVPLTLPAHASLMTGRLPPSHTVRDNGSYRLPASETTLAEALAGAGFSTGAFVGSQVLDSTYGLDQGFATYDDNVVDSGPSGLLYYPERRGEEVVKVASRWLDAQGDGPVFAWVHLFDPHTPYRPPEPERSVYGASYEGEIAYADRVVGILLDHWSERRGLDRTLVVVTADHGEGLGEHGEMTHGVLVHDATLRVPLVIRAAGLHVAGGIAAPVSLIDVMPTVLALVGVPCPAGVQGRDLSPLLRGRALAWSRTSGYAESLYASFHHGCVPLHALREGGFKLVRGVADDLFDLTADPHELRVAADAARSSAMAAALSGLIADLAPGVASRVTPDDEARRALSALGYAGSPTPRPATNGPPRDPREALVSLSLMADADRRAVAGDLASAVSGYRAVLQAEPFSVDARVRLAQILISQNRAREATPLLSAAVAIAPGEAFLHRKLGETLQATGDDRAALAAYDAGLKVQPESRDLRNGRWSCLNRLHRQDIMLAEAGRAIAADPKDGAARYARAMACCGQGRIDVYLAALEREVRELPGDKVLESALAAARAEAASKTKSR